MFPILKPLPFVGKNPKGKVGKKITKPICLSFAHEAEWEYACRASTTGVCGIGEGNFLSGENANIDGSKRGYVIDCRPRSEFSTGSSFIPIWRKALLPVMERSTLSGKCMGCL